MVRHDPVPRRQPSPAGKAIIAAHQSGRLLAHMFEFAVPDKSEIHPLETQLSDFFAVMSGNPDSHFKGEYWDITGSSEGHPALPTTMLKGGLPVQLWNNYSNVGIVLDSGDTEHVKPLFVSTKDAYSRFEGDKLIVSCDEVMDPAREKIWCMQGGSPEADMNSRRRMALDLEDKSGIIGRAREALSIFWELVEPRWDECHPVKFIDYSGMNEVLVMGRLEAVKGLLVSEKPIPTERRIAPSQQYRIAVKQAEQVRDELCRRYPSVFPEPLPIVSYNADRSRGRQLRVLTPEQIQNPALQGSGLAKR